jgi:hypothetical protein
VIGGSCLWLLTEVIGAIAVTGKLAGVGQLVRWAFINS